MSKHQHYWLDTGIPHPLVFLNGGFRYDCSVCDKQIWRKSQPVNPIVPSAWEVYESEVRKDNTHLVMSPPIQIGQESQFSEGLRYKTLMGRM